MGWQSPQNRLMHAIFSCDNAFPKAAGSARVDAAGNWDSGAASL
jgi:hypothetical protein